MGETLLRLWEDGAARGQCHGCEADIVWYETLNAKRMPMNAGAVPRKSDVDPLTHRVVLFFAADDSHFTTCPEAAKFSAKVKRR